MQIKLKKSYILDLSILWLIMASGSEFFMNENMIFTDCVMIVLSVAVLSLSKKLPKENNNIIIIIVIYIFINTLINIKNGIYINDVIINVTKLMFVLIIAGNITLEEFVRKYVKTMICLSIISIVCFGFIQITEGGPLPLQCTYVNPGGWKVFTTFYHTVGWEPLNGIYYYTKGYGYFTRNAGLFWEPGAYQIYLNLALFLLVARSELFEKDRKYKCYIPILIITILTTQSTTAILCLLCNLIFFLFYKNKVNKRVSKIATIVISVFAIIMLEASTQIVENKLFNHAASYVTRFTDTTVGLRLILDNPIFGYGLFSKEYLQQILSGLGIENMSNGLAVFALNLGLIGMVFYLTRIAQRIYVISRKMVMPTMIIFIEFILMVNSESIMLAPVFLIFLFEFRNEKVKIEKGSMKESREQRKSGVTLV